MVANSSFKLGQAVSQFGVPCEQLPQAHERPHDFDIHPHSMGNAKNAGKHGHTLFRKGMRVVLSMLAAACL